MQFLAKHEEQRYLFNANRLPNLIIFLLRLDGTADEDVKSATMQSVEENFKILRVVDLDDSKIRRVTRFVRGGNWLEHGGREYVPPTVALICNDQSPIPFDSADQRVRKYPLISNANVLCKNDIRDEINRRFPTSGSKRIVLHASDNKLEAQHHLEAVFGDEYQEICDLLVTEA